MYHKHKYSFAVNIDSLLKINFPGLSQVSFEILTIEISINTKHEIFYQVEERKAAQRNDSR